MANFLLFFFVTSMIVYLPIHMHQTLGFSWETIGLLFTIMLVPYVVLDIPLGYIADTYLGEKELISISFIVIALSTFPIAFISSTSFLLWMILLLVMRAGTGVLDAMTDIYFFKNVNAEDEQIIGIYRSTKPLSYIAAPLFSSAMLFVPGITEAHLFAILALVILIGLTYSLPLKDTS